MIPIPFLGTLFNIVTFPGILVNNLVQNLYEERRGIRETLDVAVEDLDDLEPDKVEVLVERLDGSGVDEREAIEEEFGVEPFLRPDYGAVSTYRDLLAVAAVPFVVTTVLTVAIYAVVGDPRGAGAIPWIGWYLGFAIGAQSFPNALPTDALWRRTSEGESLLRVLGLPFVALSKLMATLRILWADAIYSFGLYHLAQYLF